MKLVNWAKVAPVLGPNWRDVPSDSWDDQRLYSWLCGCGKTRPLIDSPAYPICECGQRMRSITAPHLGYVDSREQRIERLRDEHRVAWQKWIAWRERVRSKGLEYGDWQWKDGEALVSQVNHLAWELEVA